MFTKIVVGTDGSPTANRAVAMAASLAKQNGAVLHIVNAYKLPASSVAVGMGGPTAVVVDDLSDAQLSKESTTTLNEARTLVGDVEVEAHSGIGSAADVIVGVAEAVEADLIVVGSKGMRGARRVIGSVPNSIAHRAPCNVLVAKTT